MRQNPLEGDVSELVERCRRGDQDAAATLFHQYVHQLIVLVRSRLSQRMARRIDPDDVLQSAYRSFFGGLGEGEFKIETNDELWGLLATITLHKLYRKVAHHSAKRRSVHRELDSARDDNLILNHPDLIASMPTPTQAVEVMDELEQVMQKLTDQERSILELRLEGHTSEEIADRLHRSDRTVRRAMEKVRAEFERRIAETSSS